MKNTCTNTHCNEPVRAKGLCNACYTRMLYWRDKTGSEIMARQQQLLRIGDTMDAVSPAVLIGRGKRRAK